MLFYTGYCLEQKVWIYFYLQHAESWLENKKVNLPFSVNSQHLVGAFYSEI